MGQQTLCDIGFVLFVVSWIITRHVLYNMVLFSAWTHPAKYIVQLRPEPDEYWYWTDVLRNVMVGLLCVLQFLLCLWFIMIARVVHRVMAGHAANDSRSSDEESEDEVVEEQQQVAEHASTPSSVASKLKRRR